MKPFTLFRWLSVKDSEYYTYVISIMSSVLFQFEFTFIEGTVEPRCCPDGSETLKSILLHMICKAVCVAYSHLRSE